MFFDLTCCTLLVSSLPSSFGFLIITSHLDLFSTYLDSSLSFTPLFLPYFFSLVNFAFHICCSPHFFSLFHRSSFSIFCLLCPYVIPFAFLFSCLLLSLFYCAIFLSSSTSCVSRLFVLSIPPYSSLSLTYCVFSLFLPFLSFILLAFVPFVFWFLLLLLLLALFCYIQTSFQILQFFWFSRILLFLFTYCLLILLLFLFYFLSSLSWLVLSSHFLIFSSPLFSAVLQLFPLASPWFCIRLLLASIIYFLLFCIVLSLPCYIVFLLYYLYYCIALCFSGLLTLALLFFPIFLSSLSFLLLLHYILCTLIFQLFCLFCFLPYFLLTFSFSFSYFILLVPYVPCFPLNLSIGLFRSYGFFWYIVFSLTCLSLFPFLLYGALFSFSLEFCFDNRLSCPSGVVHLICLINPSFILLSSLLCLLSITRAVFSSSHYFSLFSLFFRYFFWTYCLNSFIKLIG